MQNSRKLPQILKHRIVQNHSKSLNGDWQKRNKDRKREKKNVANPQNNVKSWCKLFNHKGPESKDPPKVTMPLIIGTPELIQCLSKIMDGNGYPEFTHSYYEKIHSPDK